MKPIYFLVLIVVLLTSCSTTPPTTPPPLTEQSLSEIMFFPGDLPTGYEPSEFRSREVEGVLRLFIQDIAYNGEVKGKVTVYLYDTSEQASSAFQAVASTQEWNDPSFTHIEIEDLGENAFGQQIYIPSSSGLDPVYEATVNFVRCKAGVLTEIRLANAYMDLIDYAKKLDERLSSLVCP